MTDLHAPKAKKALQQAHLSLILTKGYESTTVRDICETANVGRSTFYSHFTSKADLKRSGFDELRKSLLANQGASRNAHGEFEFSLPMFEHASQFREHYRALAKGRGGVIALKALRKTLTEVIKQERLMRQHQVKSDNGSPDYRVDFVVGAYMSMLTQWLDRGAKDSPEQMNTLFQALACKGIGAR